MFNRTMFMKICRLCNLNLIKLSLRYQSHESFTTAGAAQRLVSNPTGELLKPYPTFMERQVELVINTSTRDDVLTIDKEEKIQIQKPQTLMTAKVNYIDTNPLGDKNQDIVLIVHGYPGSYSTTLNLVEEFQRRNYRVIAPDMPFCGKTVLPMLNMFVWSNNIWQRARIIGELMKYIMETKLRPVHCVIGFNENAFSLMSMIDQYKMLNPKSLIMIDPAPRKLLRFVPLSKFVFDFIRLPLHWPVARHILRFLGYKELLTHTQRDIAGALRIWLTEIPKQIILTLYGYQEQKQ
ncbi:unnamed protein product [Didymodactylos carnosus]|uniref:Uncharacterized protein n=1 Tax=Didymodactylos carnosus TaxID=1234261 RepID=A0A8S2QME3_9BILA|nr:unnamed protein product [Didymodactylos carnosus]CAF4114343.1 unnamed protein product [Didymodactylos carnosus]